MSYRAIGDVQFMSKRAELMENGYVSLGSFANPMHSKERPWESFGLRVNYERIYLHAYMAQVHSSLTREEALKVASNHMNLHPTLNSAVPEPERKEREEGVAQ